MQGKASGKLMGLSISHTIAAVLLVPIATRIGESLEEPHPRLLIMVRTTPCISTFLNLMQQPTYSGLQKQGIEQDCVADTLRPQLLSAQQAWAFPSRVSPT